MVVANPHLNLTVHFLRFETSSQKKWPISEVPTFLTLPWKEKSGHFDLWIFAEFRGISEHALKHMVFGFCGFRAEFAEFPEFLEFSKIPEFRNSCLFHYTTYSIKQEHRNTEF